jgi:hypothetical protein
MPTHPSCGAVLHAAHWNFNSLAIKQAEIVVIEGVMI